MRKKKTIIDELEHLLKHQPSITGNTPAQVNEVWAQRVQRVVERYGPKLPPDAGSEESAPPRPATWCTFERYTEVDGSENLWPRSALIAGKTVHVFIRARGTKAPWAFHSTVRAYRAKKLQKELNRHSLNVLISPKELDRSWVLPES